MAIRVRDDMGRELLIVRPPRRIVSLVPSDTHTLFALGVGDRLIGRTRFCVHPAAEVEAVPIVGGTKDVDVDAVCALAPDLIVANQEENARPALEALAQRGQQVFVSFPQRVADGLALIARLARIVGVDREPDAIELVRRGHRAVESARAAARAREADGLAPLRVFAPIWMDPLMTFSGDTYGSDMLAMCGADNAFGDRRRRYPLSADLGRREPLSGDRVGARDTRYPRITAAEIEQRAPDAVLLPDEPYAFTDADEAAFRAHSTPAAARGAIRRVSGRDLFWYGACGIEALERLRAVCDALRPGR